MKLYHHIIVTATSLGMHVMSSDRKILVEIIARKSHAPSIFGILGILLLISKLTQMTRPSQSVMMTRKMQNMSWAGTH